MASPSATGPPHASERVTAVPAPRPMDSPNGWTPRHSVALAAAFAVAVVIRLMLLPAGGLRGDIDEFVLWAHDIAVNGIGRAYEQDITFPPVMVYVWSILAVIEPTIRSVTDASDTTVRAVMKLPASVADLALAGGVAWALRARPAWAVAAGLAVALHPAVFYVSAWWGQYESLYVLGGLIAFLLAVAGRPGWAAVAVAAALMTKPQALPFIAPFAGWYLGRYGLLGSLRYVAVGTAVLVVLWLPFVPHGGPAPYLRNVVEYQSGVFAVLSLRAWNPWWLLQEAAGYGEFISDSSAIVGPVTLRVIGYAAALLLELVVFLAVLRSPTPRALALGLATSTLAAFTLLTSMHERYAYGALVFLVLLLPDRRILALWLAFSVVFTVNLLVAVPPTTLIERAVPVFGPLGVLGSIAMSACAIASLLILLTDTNHTPDGRLARPDSDTIRASPA